MASASSSIKNKKGSKTFFQGLAFLEFAAPQPTRWHNLLKNMGFQSYQKHRRRDLTLYKQGNIRFLLNAEPDSFAASFASARGAAVCGMGIYVQDALETFAAAVERGAIPLSTASSGMEAHIPVVHGPGDTLLYFIECGDGGISALDLEFKSFPSLDLDTKTGAELTDVHHIHFSLIRSDISAWSTFFQDILGFSLYAPSETEGFLSPLREGAALAAPSGTFTLTFQEHLSLPAPFSTYSLIPLPPTGVEFVSLQSRNLIASVNTFWRKNITLLPQIVDTQMADDNTLDYPAPPVLPRPQAKKESAPTDSGLWNEAASSPLNVSLPHLPRGMTHTHNKHLQDVFATLSGMGGGYTLGVGHAGSGSRTSTAVSPSNNLLASSSHTFPRPYGDTETSHLTRLPSTGLVTECGIQEDPLYLWSMRPTSSQSAELEEWLPSHSTFHVGPSHETHEEFNSHNMLLETLELLGEYMSFHTERLGAKAPKTILRAQTHSLMGSFFFEFQQEVTPQLVRPPIKTHTAPQPPMVAADPFGLLALWGV